MDKYHIYEEVGAGTHSQVFKGREKMDIEYVAIKRVEKRMMDQVVNEVQVIHRLSSPNVLKFYDWYETRNNVWLILEFCTGGDLLTLIKQDHREPESAVRLFGVDLLAGLQQTHACGFLHGDLNPSNVLIDEYGILKLSGFGLARSIPERGEKEDQAVKKDGQQAASAAGTQSALGDPAYMAPELFLEGMNAASFASDFWSLGCVLFELLTGEPPFGDSSYTTIDHIARENPPGLDKGEWRGASMSPDFCSLVRWLLNKDPLQRPTWPQLLAHPFWGNCQTPSPLEMPVQPRFDHALAAATSAASIALTVNAQRQESGREKADYYCEQACGKRKDVGDSKGLSVEGHDSRTQGVPGAQDKQEEGDSGRGGTVAHGEGELIDRAKGRRRREPVGVGVEDKLACGNGGDDGCSRDAAALSDRFNLAQASIADAGQSRVDGAEGERGGNGSALEVRPLMDRTETNSGEASGAVIGEDHSHQDERCRRKEKGRHRRGGVHVVEEETTAMNDGQQQNKNTAVLATHAADERSRAPSHGSSGGGAREAAGGVAVADASAGRGGARGRARSDEAARRAAALDSLRLRGKIPPMPLGGRTSPSVSASASSSVGELYGSSFEEDTEGSSSYSVEPSPSEGPAGIEPAMTATTEEGSISGAALISSTIRHNKFAPVANSRSSKNPGADILAAGDGRVSHVTTPPYGKRPPEGDLGRAPSSAVRSVSSGSVGLASRSDFASPVTVTTGGSRSVRSGSGSGSGSESAEVARGDALAALSFARAASPYSSDHVSSSSWTSSGVSSARFVGAEAGQWAGSNSCTDAAGGEGVCASSGGSGSGGVSTPRQRRRPELSHEAIGGRKLIKAELVSDVNGGAGGGANAYGLRVGRREPEARAFSPVSEEMGAPDGRRKASRSCLRDHKESSGGDDGGRVGDGGEVERRVRSELSEGNGGGQNGSEGLRELLLHTSDAQVTPIVGNKSIEASSSSPTLTRSWRDQLSFETFLPARVAGMSPQDLEAHLTVVYNVINDSSAPVRQRGQTLLYLQTLSAIPRVTDLVLNSKFLVMLLRLLRKPRPAAIRGTVATLLGLLVRHATYISPSAGRPSTNSPGAGGDPAVAPAGQEDAEALAARVGDGKNGGTGGGLVSVLIAIVRERPAPGRAAQAAALRRSAMAALGELLFYVVSQEPQFVPQSASGGGAAGGRRDKESWRLPVAGVGGAIFMCLEDAEYDGVRHYAAKTLENVLAQAAPSHALVEILVTQRVALCLLDLASHASSESLRCTAAAGLSHLLEHDVLGGACGSRIAGPADSCTVGLNIVRDDDCGGASGANGRGTSRSSSSGQIASRVMCEPGAASAVVNGLSEGNSLVFRRAFLHIFNLVLWSSITSINYRNDTGSDGSDDVSDSDGGKINWPAVATGDDEGKNEHGRLSAGKSRSHPFRRAVEAMLESQMLLPRLLRAAEHGEVTILRAKAFVALRLALEAASPSLLLRACGSRLLPLLARAIGALAPRADPPSTSTAAPSLSHLQDYLYQCCNELADWLCAIPEGAARCLAAELRLQKGNACTARGRHGGCHEQEESRSYAQTNATAEATPSVGGARRLKVAMSAFPIVVHLVNSPLLRGRAVTSVFVSDVAACLASSCPVVEDEAGVGGDHNDERKSVMTTAKAGRRDVVVPSTAATTGPPGVADGYDDSKEAVLAALLPTVETLAQQADEVLLPHWEAVADELIPVICRLLKSPSGDTRAIAVAILRVLLPPLLRPAHPPQSPFLNGITPARSRANVNAPVHSAATAAMAAPGAAAARVRHAISVHLLPSVASLFRDHAPIPQYVTRVLVDVAREWSGLGVALLLSGDAISALVDRLPRHVSLFSPSPPPPPTPRSALPASPWPPAAMCAMSSSSSSHSPAGKRDRVPELGSTAAAGMHSGMLRSASSTAVEPVDAAALDPALAALITLLIDRDDGGGSGDEKRTWYEDLIETLLRLELPGRVAAAVAGAVKVGNPEAAESFLGLAVALLSAGNAGNGNRHGVGAPPAAGGGLGSDAIVMGGSVVGVGADAGRAALWEPFITAAPLVLESIQIFCVHGGAGGGGSGSRGQAQQRQQVVGTGGGGIFVDDGLRSGISDSATVFLTMCHQLFHDRLLQAFFLPQQLLPATGNSRPTPSPAQVCRQFADLLGCPHVDERARLRALRLLLAAARHGSYASALGNGPLWTTLLRTASGRIAAAGSGGRGRGVGGNGAAGGSRGGRGMGETQTLAREIVSAVRGGRGKSGGVVREGRPGSGRLFGGGDVKRGDLRHR